MKIKISFFAIMVFLLFANLSKAQTTNVLAKSGDWYSTACNDPKGIVWHFGTNNKGYISMKDCNGYCKPMVLKFSYTVTGSTLKTVYDASQDAVDCSGEMTKPKSPKETSQEFVLKGNTLTVSYGGTTTVFTNNASAFEPIYCFVSGKETNATGSMENPASVVSNIVIMECGASPSGNIAEQFQKYYLANHVQNSGVVELWPKYTFPFKTKLEAEAKREAIIKAVNASNEGPVREINGFKFNCK